MNITLDNINALNRFALANPRNWKSKLHRYWLNAEYPSTISLDDQAHLQQVRNNAARLLFSGFKAREAGYSRVVFLKKIRMEVRGSQEVTMKTGWRLLDEHSVDVILPWMGTKTEATDTAAEFGWFIADTLY